MSDLPPRWYVVDKDGLATLCKDYDHAQYVAAASYVAWPRRGPYRAVLLGDVAAAVAQERAAASITLAHDGHPVAVADVLRRSIAGLAYDYTSRKRRPSRPFWAFVKDVTAYGSNYSAGLAKWAGFDPDTAAAIRATEPKP